jgi:hypothetical protein
LGWQEACHWRSDCTLQIDGKSSIAVHTRLGGAVRPAKADASHRQAGGGRLPWM